MDNDFYIASNKSKCEVLDEDDNLCMVGSKSSENYNTMESVNVENYDDEWVEVSSDAIMSRIVLLEYYYSTHFGKPDVGVTTGRQSQNVDSQVCFTSNMEYKNIYETFTPITIMESIRVLLSDTYDLKSKPS